MTDSESLENVRAAKAHALTIFSELAEVVGVGVMSMGSGYGLKVNLAALPTPNIKLPTHVDGVPVKVEVVGLIKKRPPKLE